MPSYRHHDFGNLYVKFTVEFPQENFATNEQLAILEQVLPPRQPIELPEGAVTDDVVLGNVDPMDLKRAEGNAGRRRAANGDVQMMDEDEEEEGGPGVQVS